MTPEQFKKLSKKEQKIAIAKDVIAAIEAKVYKPKKGKYIETIKLQTSRNLLHYSSYNNNLQGNNYDSIQDNFEQIKSCTACALGLCILSITKFKNKLVFF